MHRSHRKSMNKLNENKYHSIFVWLLAVTRYYILRFVTISIYNNNNNNPTCETMAATHSNWHEDKINKNKSNRTMGFRLWYFCIQFIVSLMNRGIE